MRFTCPHCGASLKVRDKHIGHIHACGRCHQKTVVHVADDSEGGAAGVTWGQGISSQVIRLAELFRAAIGHVRHFIRYGWGGIAIGVLFLVAVFGPAGYFERVISPIVVLAIVVGGIFLYVLPTVIAEKRSHPHAAAILVVNLLLGWTLIGWAVALAWSCMGIDRAKDYR